MGIDQWFIAVLGLTVTWLSQAPDKNHRKWACIIALLVQPFWLYTTYVHNQWGIFILTVVSCVVWSRGIITYWWVGEN